MTRPSATTWWLPTSGVNDPCPDQRWRVTYARKGMTLNVEVCAPDEDTAVMRAGMKRAAMLELDKPFWSGELIKKKPTKWFSYPKYKKVKVEKVGNNSSS